MHACCILSYDVSCYIERRPTMVGIAIPIKKEIVLRVAAVLMAHYIVDWTR